MYKVFPSSLGPAALRWFKGLRKGSIHNFVKLIQEFGIRFITCSLVPQPIDALLSMKMRVGETLRSYAGWYWELYNEIGRGNEKIAASTFRMGLPEDFRLRESLTKKPPEDMRQLMRRIEKYKWLEDDWLQNKGKAPMANRPRQDSFQPKNRGDLRIQKPEAPTGEVNVMFKELMHTIIDKIKHEPYFWWPNRMGGNPSRRNHNLYCTYHKGKGHTTEQCRVLRDHLGQLAKAGHLKEFVVDTRDRRTGQGTLQRSNPLPPPLGIIKVIHAPPRKLVVARKKGVLTVVPVEGTIQSHDNALIVSTRISGFLVKKVMIDQVSGTDVMYPDLFKGLGLKNEDLSEYTTPLVGFDGKLVVLEGQVFLPMNMEGREVVITFIVVPSFSPYTAILGRPWIHAMGVVPSTLHVKVKFPTEHGITVVQGSQQMTKQCLVAIVNQEKG
ncbi:uncharacterized protein LOC111990281 [Quercus suber]|uniref:uncharacterized protein LOC111990281 n=1 Tax=Quercus suber TaxID=58331 RepID=UPI0032DE6746